MRETMRRTCVMQNINLNVEFNWISCHPSVSCVAGQRRDAHRGTKAIRHEDHQELGTVLKDWASGRKSKKSDRGKGKTGQSEYH